MTIDLRSLAHVQSAIDLRAMAQRFGVPIKRIGEKHSASRETLADRLVRAAKKNEQLAMAMATDFKPGKPRRRTYRRAG